jgi:hypothetical protein
MRILASVVAAGAAVSACQAPMATLERTVKGDPGKPYYGMTKAEIIACAGAPHGSYQRGEAESITYHYSGAGPVPGAAPKKSEKSGKPDMFGRPKEDKNWACAATLTFEQGRLTRVTYAPSAVVSPYATKTDPKSHEKVPVPQPEPCTFSLPNCAAR